MFRRTFTVSYSPFRNNYVTLPDNYHRMLSSYKNGCLSITHGIDSFFMSWSPFGGGGYQDNRIGINAQVATAMGLKEGDAVMVAMIIEARSLKTVEVTAASEKDWDMLQVSSSRIQSILLDQTRIVTKGQNLIVWVNDSISIKIKIKFTIPPLPYGRLENDTELVVEPYKKPMLKKEAQTVPSALTRSNTNLNIAELVRMRNQQRSKPNGIENGDTLISSVGLVSSSSSPVSIADSIKKRPITWHKNNGLENGKENHPKESTDKPKENGILKRSSTHGNGVLSNAQTAVRNSLFESDLDRHLSKLQTSKTIANIITERPIIADEPPKPLASAQFKNKSQYLDDLVATLTREVPKSYEFRVIRGVWNCRRNNSQICDIYITKENIPAGMDIHLPFLLSTNDDREYFVNVRLTSDAERFPSNAYPTVEVNDKLMEQLEIHHGEKITLRAKQNALNIVDMIELVPATKVASKIESDIVEKFKEFILFNSKVHPVLLNQGQVFRLPEYYLTVKLQPGNLKYCLVNAVILRQSKIMCSGEVKNLNGVVPSEDDEKKKCLGVGVEDQKVVKIGKFQKIVDDCVDQLKLKLCLDERSAVRKSYNVIVAGSNQSGKRTIVQTVLRRLAEAPYHCFTTTFQCSKHKGRKPDSILKDLRHAFYMCMFHSPAVLYLEGLDVLTHNPGDQNTQDAEYHNKVSDVIRKQIEEFTSTNPISVIASISSVANLNQRLYSSRGSHLFHDLQKVPNLDKTDREIVIKSLFVNKRCKLEKKINWKKLANSTEGYSVGSLVQMVDRAVFYAFKKNSKSPLVTDGMIGSALDVTNEYCLQGIESHKRSDEPDDDDDVPGDKVPGLETAIDVFQEVLMWPTKFPKIFECSPLRNQAGILLFGPPGTGKTYLVSKLAKTWNLRMISVKGPELLAKYIGQSEENVRNLFDRARSAKPCVLFFDEFDSLAPRRGHDSTGVTDRVVNQLLTELDGVEGLQGVTVIGATSRPELLDPALLRSGRIDRLVECSLPDEKSRLAIFKNQSSSLDLAADVQLPHFAKKANSYTGADIQSILTTANMLAVQECLTSAEDDEHVPEKITINQRHLLEAFASTRPSLSPQDVQKYKDTYARFTNKEPPSRDFVAKRATLA
ncbi:peroxisome biogenesis factor 1 [Aedes aegypti]|uniref:Peroxisomal ATPase PEX1 n=1 Tax=Aedes aegypti TaxID=7159 RepID=A0A6I8U4X8_AEDAE|nr:peroxisome biogenesis factor 1 [Aedes aegypti]